MEINEVYLCRRKSKLGGPYLYSVWSEEPRMDDYGKHWGEVFNNYSPTKFIVPIEDHYIPDKCHCKFKNDIVRVNFNSLPDRLRLKIQRQVFMNVMLKRTEDILKNTWIELAPQDCEFVEFHIETPSGGDWSIEGRFGNDSEFIL